MVRPLGGWRLLLFPALALAGWIVIREQSGFVVQLPASWSASQLSSNAAAKDGHGARRIRSDVGGGGGNDNKDPSPSLAEALATVLALEDQVEELAARMQGLAVAPNTRNGNNVTGQGTATATTAAATNADRVPAVPPLPTCDDLMRQPNSPFQDGSFLARHTTDIRWVPRRDGSRQLELAEICRLKRYTAKEANQCLTHTHISMIGDSVTRYQHLSLAHLLEHGHYPPRFARPASASEPCRHMDEMGNAACAPFHEPNVCVESDWTGWDNYYEALCGSTNGGLMNGRMECHSVRIKGSQKMEWNDNMLYVNGASRAVLSFAFETGFGDNKEAPLFGFNFTNCSYDGTCRRTRADSDRLRRRTLKNDFDWRQSFPDVVGPNGSLRSVLPPVDYALYGRGIWGKLSENRAAQIFPALRDWVSTSHNHKGGRCFFKSTTGHAKSIKGDHFRDELHKIRPHVLHAGCTYLDHAYLTDSFGALLEVDSTALRNPLAERRSVFVDPVHYHPWVYEELNNLLLNVLCNDRKLDEDVTG